MIYIIITLSLIVSILVFTVYNLLSKTEKLEKLVDDQNTYIDRLSELIDLSNKIDLFSRDTVPLMYILIRFFSLYVKIKLYGT